jgi:hypothetical protein
MDRRTFLKTSGVATSALGAAGIAAATGSCSSFRASNMFEGLSPPLPEMNSYLKKIDNGLEYISNTSWIDSQNAAVSDANSRMKDDLSRKALKSLYVAGMFGDLTDEGQMHPGMQRRVFDAMPGMHDAIFSTCNYLENLSSAEKAKIHRLLNQRSNPGLKVVEQLNRHAEAVGISASRRLQTRSMATQIISRMRNQSPDLVFGEYIGKVRKVEARSGSIAEVERQMAARMTKDEFFARQQRLASLAARWEAELEFQGTGFAISTPQSSLAPDAGAETGVSSPESVAVPAQPPPTQNTIVKQDPKHSGLTENEHHKPGRKAMITGGWMMGIGVVVFGVSVAVASAGSGGIAILFVATAGGIALLIGLITLLAGVATQALH